MRVPLLIISDAPSASSGLGRITRDLALGIHHNLPNEYEVATFGYGGSGDRNLPFIQYPIENMHEWFLPTLQDVWYNFAGTRKGAVLCVWDPARLLWFGRPDQKLWSRNKEMSEWLMTKPFEKWIYAPMDAEGPMGKLSIANAECLYGFDRIIAYSEWEKKVIEETYSEFDCKARDLIAIPHGIHTHVFHPRREADRRGVFRQDFGFVGNVLEDYEKIVGIVATNNTRKDYGLAIGALSEVNKEVPIRVFIQIDQVEKNWAIGTLLQDFNMIHRAFISVKLVSDDAMAKAYSACDLTLGIGPEGFGFPIFESLACGTPVIAGSVGGHAEHMDPEYLIKPDLTRLESVFNCVRPVYDPKKWAWKIKKALTRNDATPHRFLVGKSLLPPRLDWKNLWAAEWGPYFKRQHQRFQSPEPILVVPSNSPEMDTAPEARRT
jgi:glycosyltransferase involved in cell wall biosynthesis